MAAARIQRLDVERVNGHTLFQRLQAVTHQRLEDLNIGLADKHDGSPAQEDSQTATADLFVSAQGMDLRQQLNSSVHRATFQQ
jgi:hypothetical protein